MRSGVVEQAIDADMFTRRYADVFAGDQHWQSLDTQLVRRSPGIGIDVRAQTSVLRRYGCATVARHRCHGRAGPGEAW